MSNLGWKPLSEEHTKASAEILLNRYSVAEFLNKVSEIPGVDQRAISIARTNFQQAFMWLARSCNGSNDPLDPNAVPDAEEKLLLKLSLMENPK